MSASEQQSDAPVVADTVVVNYFLAVGEIQLLARLCTGVIHIPRAVFDPDEPDDAPEEALSELRRGLHLHRRRVGEELTSEPALSRSRVALPHFEQLPVLATGLLRIVELSDAELIVFSRLRDPQAAAGFGLVSPLGAGESAALAIASERGWQLATDDQDAIRVAEQLMPGLRPLRIRALLQAAADTGLVAIERAREIHEAIKSAGFWDKGNL
jgi:predicted nucleic acid-binding protein